MENSFTTEEKLCKELEDFCKKEGLQYQSADELLFEDITDEQRRWLSDFVQRWEYYVES